MKKLNLLTAILLALFALSCEKDETKPIPTAPKLLEPADGAITGTDSVTFKWGEGTDPGGSYVSYVLFCSKDKNEWAVPDLDAGTNDKSETIIAGKPNEWGITLEKGQKYYWKVRTKVARGFSEEELKKAESEVFSFYTAPPGVVSLHDSSGYGFANLYWEDPQGLDYVEITFTPEVDGINQPVKVNAGVGKAGFKGLENGTIYSFYVKAFNTLGHGSETDTIKALPLLPNQAHDADLNVYTTTTMGNQTWLRENLKTTKYQDGSPIKKYYIGSKSDKYGYYYPLEYAIGNEQQNICPCGYHVPTDEDFKELERFWGMTEEDIEMLEFGIFRGDEETAKVGYVLKSGTDWLDYEGKSGNGNNLNGFSLYPSGSFYREGPGADDYKEDYLGKFAELGTSTKYETENYITRYFSNRSDGITRFYRNKVRVVSIRCIKSESK